MTIQEIKDRLDINEVLSYYGVKSDKNKMLNCPFHDDKTPSMRIYEETNTAYCFSGNCKLQEKSIDQIDFILYKEECTKHEAIEKAKQIIGMPTENRQEEKDLQSIFEILRKSAQATYGV